MRAVAGASGCGGGGGRGLDVDAGGDCALLMRVVAMVLGLAVMFVLGATQQRSK